MIFQTSIFVLIAFVSSCMPVVKKEVEILDIKSNAQFFLFDKGKLEQVHRTVKKVSGEDFTMYIFMRKSSLIEDKIDSEGNIKAQILKRIDTSYIYYVIRKDGLTGKVYGKRNKRSANGEAFNLEDMLKTEGLNVEAFESYSSHLKKPIQVIKDHDGRLIKKYLVDRVTPEYPDSLYQMFDKRLTNVNFTFSKTVDELAQNKLVKITTVSNPTQVSLKGKIFNVPRRETNLEIAIGTFPIDSIWHYRNKLIKERE